MKQDTIKSLFCYHRKQRFKAVGFEHSTHWLPVSFINSASHTMCFGINGHTPLECPRSGVVGGSRQPARPSCVSNNTQEGRKEWSMQLKLQGGVICVQSSSQGPCQSSVEQLSFRKGLEKKLKNT